MLCLSKTLSKALCLFLLIALGSESTLAHPSAQQADRPADKQDNKNNKAEKREQRKNRRARKAEEKEADEKKKDQERAAAGGAADSSDLVDIISDNQSQEGDLVIAEGYVNATLGDFRLQADRVTFNKATGDMVAEGSVIFDEGADQRVTARRAEINWPARRGTFWDATGFTNRTATGEYIYFTAERVEKTGPQTYELFNASVTACEDVVPKWSFSAKRAEVKMDDRVKLYNSVFRIRSVPAFVLPFAWIPATRTERKSGFLLPTLGSSNQKGRTFKTAYYQTLGQSADITFRNDIYTARGIGFGAEFRAQTDEKSFLRLGSFTVKDRLFGEAGDDQGGTAFVAEAVQYLPRGWLAVGNVSLVTSLKFRQVFSDDISQVVDPRRESRFYVNNNAGGFSFNFLVSNETTRIFRPDRDQQLEDPAPTTGVDFDIKVRQAPQVELALYPRRVFDSLPIYFSFDSSLGALKREETVDDNRVLVTPAAVQRFDFQPKITLPLATVAGFAITPSVSLRGTFYTSSLDPLAPTFGPEEFALNPADPRIDPKRPEFNPRITLFDLGAIDPILPESISRHYAEVAIDIRPPSLEKVFLKDDGSRRFKHVVEPYITYRLIAGVGNEFNEIIRFDERDAVANTNEFEYAVVNRFFTTRRDSELTGRRRRRRRDDSGPDQMKPVQVDKERRKKKDPEDKDSVSKPPSGVASSAEPQAAEKDEEQKPAPRPEAVKKGDAKAEPAGDPRKEPRLEMAEQADLTGQAERDLKERAPDEASNRDEDDAAASNENAPPQPYELLSIKVAQKYFFDRDFGGALTPGRRNQFYPINTLSGFTFGGAERSFSPLNLAVRYRPLSSVYADVRMDVGSDGGAVRNVKLSGGVTKERFSASASWHLSRKIEIEPNSFEPGTFPGNQIETTFQLGDESRGLYGGTRIGYDFTDRFVSDELSTGRLRNSRSYMGYSWDCCGLQFNYNTFKAGLRNESAFSFTFTLAGLGSFGTDQISQLADGRGARRRGRRARRNQNDDIP